MTLGMAKEHIQIIREINIKVNGIGT
jgi:hypothetical protein